MAKKDIPPPGGITIGQFQLSEFATVAEQIAKQKALDKDTKTRMDAEALRLQTELAEALFAPYVGKQIRVDSRYTFTLFRHEHYTGKTKHLFAFDPSRPGHTGKPGSAPESYCTKGWTVSVAWDITQQRMRASLTPQTERSTPVEGGEGDIGTQAVRLARVLAEQIGAVLILESTTP